MRSIPSAPALWATALVWVLVNDAMLVAQGRQTMSEWYAEHAVPLSVASVYLLCHLHGRPRGLSRFDPLHHAAVMIRRAQLGKTPVALVAPS